MAASTRQWFPGKLLLLSLFCEFGFWDWVEFQEKGVTFPDITLVLGKYFGPSIDMGTAMTQRIMKANSEIKDRSTVWSLTSVECVSTPPHLEQEKFFEAIQ
jgi:hypothetical protein